MPILFLTDAQKMIDLLLFIYWIRKISAQHTFEKSFTSECCDFKNNELFEKLNYGFMQERNEMIAQKKKNGSLLYGSDFIYLFSKIKCRSLIR